MITPFLYILVLNYTIAGFALRRFTCGLDHHLLFKIEIIFLIMLQIFLINFRIKQII